MIDTPGGPRSDQAPSSEQREVRLAKAAQSRAMGLAPYRDRFVRTHRLCEAAALPDNATDLAVAGRLILRRKFGKLTFAHLQDGTAAFQVALERDKVATGDLQGREAYDVFQRLVDLGDFVGAEGDLMRTKTGELTLNVRRFTLLSKALRPLPEKYHGLRDQEACYRQRYLDLVMNEATRARFHLRGRVIQALRDALNRAGFTEVDTPILVPTASGALATPFLTHHRALDMPAYLRIAPETYLKRLLVGGMERVYEFARSFRNEGMDPSHLQEFTLLEFYCAYWSYEDNMDFTQRLIAEVVLETTGALTVTCGGRTIDLTPPWPRVTFKDVLETHAGVRPEDFADEEALRAEIRRRGIAVEGLEHMGWGSLLDQLFKKCCRPALIKPTFLTGHPIALSPLARRSDNAPGITDRFQLLINGWEIVNAYSELIDPQEQRLRFEEQARLLQRGDAEAMACEEDYLLAMEYGMPPASGWGMGLERFLCLLSDRENLRDVVLFPFMRPQNDCTPDAGTDEQSKGAPGTCAS